LLQMVYYI